MWSSKHNMIIFNFITDVCTMTSLGVCEVVTYSNLKYCHFYNRISHFSVCESRILLIMRFYGVLQLLEQDKENVIEGFRYCRNVLMIVNIFWRPFCNTFEKCYFLNQIRFKFNFISRLKKICKDCKFYLI